MTKVFKSALYDDRGASMVLFSLLLPVVLVLLAGGVNYAYWLSDKSTAQNAADTAALTAAKEMRLGSSNPTLVSAAARTRALGILGELADAATVKVSIPSKSSVTVEIDVHVNSLLGGLAPVGAADIHAKSTAQSASTPTCLFTLDPGGSGLVVKSAAILANGCAAYSGSQKANGLSVQQGTIAAFQTCSSGGVQTKLGYILPAAITDCPVVTDPLAARAPPAVGACDFNGVKVTATATLTPGVYCGGLQVTNGASAAFQPGVYIISGGPFSVDKNAAIQGDGVGFYLAGDQSQVDFDIDSSINLVAPSDGPLAGILFFEDRNAKANQQHVLASRNAPQLLGTLYFPRGILSIGAKAPGPLDNALTIEIANCAKLSLTYPCTPSQTNLAQFSAWTIIIANSVNVSFVVNLVLNTNYSASSIKPPPEMSFKGANLTE